MNIRGNNDDQYLETMTEDIIFDLSKALPGKLKVSEVASVKKLKDKSLEIAEISKNLGVQFVFESSLQRSGDGFNLRCKLVEASTGEDKFINKWFIEENSLQSVVGVLVENIIIGLDIPMVGDFTKIETPKYGDRVALFSSLAYNNWTLKEMADGTAWRMLNES